MHAISTSNPGITVSPPLIVHGPSSFSLIPHPQRGYLNLRRSISSLPSILNVLGVDARCTLLHSVAETGLVAL